jgi:hypothetical protein
MDGYHVLSVRVPRAMVAEAAAHAGDASITEDGILQRIAEMHCGNLEEDIKWAVSDLAEDPHDASRIEPFRLGRDMDGHFAIWVDDAGCEAEYCPLRFIDEEQARVHAIGLGGREVTW